MKSYLTLEGQKGKEKNFWDGRSQQQNRRMDRYISYYDENEEIDNFLEIEEVVVDPDNYLPLEDFDLNNEPLPTNESNEQQTELIKTTKSISTASRSNSKLISIFVLQFSNFSIM